MIISILLPNVLFPYNIISHKWIEQKEANFHLGRSFYLLIENNTYYNYVVVRKVENSLYKWYTNTHTFLIVIFSTQLVRFFSISFYALKMKMHLWCLVHLMWRNIAHTLQWNAISKKFLLLISSHHGWCRPSFMTPNLYFLFQIVSFIRATFCFIIHFVYFMKPGDGLEIEFDIS